MPKYSKLFYISASTPNMNPIGQTWEELRKRGFSNEVFLSLENVVERLLTHLICLRQKLYGTLRSVSGLLNVLIKK